MKRAFAVILCLMMWQGHFATTAYCSLANENLPGLRVKSIERVLRLRPEEVDLATAALIISERWSDVVYGRRCLSELDDMALEIQKRLQERRIKTNFRAIEVVNEYLFDELGFKAVSEANDPNDLFLHTVLEKRQGYCLSLSVLYLSIGERLGLPLYGVVVPGHFFVRYEDKRARFNIETVAQGATPTDEYYITKYNVPEGVRDSIYMKNLNNIQTLGCFFNNLGIVYSDIGDNDYALETLELAVEINPVLSESRSSLGNAYLTKGQLAEAIYQYDKALEINPNDAKTHNNLGNAYTERGWTNYAISEYLSALEIDPKLPDAHKNLARAYCKQKSYGQAISQLKNLMSIGGDEADCQSQLGNVYLQMGKHKEAIRYYKKSLGIKPNLVEAGCGLAQCYNKLGLVKEEMQAYQKVLGYNPNVLPALINLGNAYFKQEQYDSAIELYSKAVLIVPEDASINYNIGAAYSNKGMYEQANAAYQNALKLDPKFADAHYGFAVCLYNLGKYDLAWKHISTAKQLGAKVTQKQLDAIKGKLR